MAREKLWARRLAAFGRDGLTRRAWCDRHGIALSTFEYWRRRLREDAAPGALAVVPVVVADAATARGIPGVIEIELSGLRLRANAGVDATWLCTVLRGLR